MIIDIYFKNGIILIIYQDLYIRLEVIKTISLTWDSLHDGISSQPSAKKQ